MNKPQLETSRLILKPLTVQDFDPFMETLADEEAMSLTGTEAEFTPELVKDFLIRIETDKNRYDWGVYLKEKSLLIGEIVLNNIDWKHKCANFRIAFSKERDKGYGTESIARVLDFAFRDIDLHRVELEVYSFNPRAIHVYKKLGFKLEGERRESFFRDGQYYSSIVMGLLADEYYGQTFPCD